MFSVNVLKFRGFLVPIFRKTKFDVHILHAEIKILLGLCQLCMEARIQYSI